MLWQVICDQASVLLTTSSVSFANWAMISASWLRVTYPPQLWLSHRYFKGGIVIVFAIVMEEAATQRHTGRSKEGDHMHHSPAAYAIQEASIKAHRDPGLVANLQQGAIETV